MNPTLTRSVVVEWMLRAEPDERGRPQYSARLFPFHTKTRVADLFDGELVEHDEEFVPGCTRRMQQVAAQRCAGKPSWISFSRDHDRSFDARLGHCTRLDEQADGAWATFALTDTGERLDRVRTMLDESHRGVSIEFGDVGGTLEVVGGRSGLHRHRQINIADVTATPVPVYAGPTLLRADVDVLSGAGTPNLDAVRQMLAAL